MPGSLTNNHQMVGSRHAVMPAHAGIRASQAARAMPSSPIRRHAVVVCANPDNNTSTEEKPEIAKVLWILSFCVDQQVC